MRRSPLFVIFTTVLVDLIGFGMIIPLVGLYGKHFGADGIELSILGAAFSVMQFLFTPFWGSLSDRVGRRPILIMSLAGSTLSYLLFAFAPSLVWLIASRAFAGLFAANISTAQAYIADVTTPSERAKGMGMIGAAFGIGFTLGPPLGGIAAAKLGLAAPGLIAAGICGLNLLLAVFRLPESLPVEKRSRNPKRNLAPLQFGRLLEAARHPELGFLLVAYFAFIFAFSNMEQTFSLLFQERFGFDTGTAGYRTGVVLMVSGLMGAVVQGGLIRKLIPKYGERKLLLAGLAINALTMGFFPFLPGYAAYFPFAVLMALGTGLINPTLNGLISRAARDDEQGRVLGISQGLGSLARAFGPFCGLLTFQIDASIPYLIAAAISLALLAAGTKRWIGTAASSTVSP